MSLGEPEISLFLSYEEKNSDKSVDNTRSNSFPRHKVWSPLFQSWIESCVEKAIQNLLKPLTEVKSNLQSKMKTVIAEKNWALCLHFKFGHC